MTRRATSKPQTPWRPPTRRAFVAMLGAAAAALALRDKRRNGRSPAVDVDRHDALDRPLLIWRSRETPCVSSGHVLASLDLCR